MKKLKSPASMTPAPWFWDVAPRSGGAVLRNADGAAVLAGLDPTDFLAIRDSDGCMCAINDFCVDSTGVGSPSIIHPDAQAIAAAPLTKAVADEVLKLAALMANRPAGPLQEAPSRAEWSHLVKLARKARP